MRSVRDRSPESAPTARCFAIEPDTEMPRIPAICDACGAVSPSPLRTDRSDGDVAFDVPCPCRACGASARVPAEVLQRLAAAVSAALESGLDEEDLERLVDLLPGASGAAGGEGTPVERVDVVSRVADGGPDLLPVARSLPEGTNAELVAFLRVVARSLALWRQDGEAEVSGALARALEVEFEAAAEEASDGEELDEETVRAAERLDAASRNDPCPCGSGRKYKDCHWLEDRRRVRG